MGVLNVSEKMKIDNIYYSKSTNLFYNFDAKAGKKVSTPDDVIKITPEQFLAWRTRKRSERVLPDENGLPEIVSAIVYSASKNTFYNLNGKHDSLPKDCLAVSVDAYEGFSNLGAREVIVPDDAGMATVQSSLAYSASNNAFYDLKLKYKNLPDDIKRITEALYLTCINIPYGSRLTSDSDGFPKVASIPKSELENRKKDAETSMQARKQYDINIASVASIRSLIVENADIFQNSEALTQLKNLQEQFNNV